MTKGLELFKNYIVSRLRKDDFYMLDVRKAIELVEKELKALEIIKEKKVDTVAFIRCYVSTNKRNEEIVSMYNKICVDPYVPFNKKKKNYNDRRL